MAVVNKGSTISVIMTALALVTKLLSLLPWMASSAAFISPGASPIKRTQHLPLIPTSAGNGVERSLKNDDVMETDSASSLASSYAIRMHPVTSPGEGGCSELKWELCSLAHWEQSNQGEGTLALRALNDCAQSVEGANYNAVSTLSCQWNGNNADAWSIDVAPVDEEGEEVLPREFLCVLSRIMLQAAASHIAKENVEKETLIRITLPLLEGGGCQKLSLSDLLPSDGDDPSGVRHLFTPLNSQYADMEIVDMVDHEGRVLGSLPRPYVHTWNILHRGIGMIVSKDVDIFEAFKSGETPEVYVHQRTSTKRVFPSLYDMFVGGVSSSGEDAKLTAAREVAEELGLKRALEVLENKEKEEQNLINPLSEKIFQCTVCTSYNRCVVSMFTYTCDTALESITWQEEEVAWGEYCPYDIIEVAAEMSIARLMKMDAWPGSSCDNDERFRGDAADNDQLKLKAKYDNRYQSWDTWDFVPDGLLVWEAWKSFLPGHKE